MDLGQRFFGQPLGKNGPQMIKESVEGPPRMEKKTRISSVCRQQCFVRARTSSSVLKSMLSQMDTGSGGGFYPLASRLFINRLRSLEGKSFRLILPEDASF